MISFKIPKTEIKNIILTYSKQNNLPEHFEEQLIIMIESSEYVDYIEMAKKEKERIEFEHEYNQITASSHKNHKEIVDESIIGKGRSKSIINLDCKGKQNYDIKQEENFDSRKFNEIDYEFIDKKDFVSNELKKNRSQSFYESSNTDDILAEKNQNLKSKYLII